MTARRVPNACGFFGETLARLAATPCAATVNETPVASAMTFTNDLQCRFLPITPPGSRFLGYCSDVESWQKLRNCKKRNRSFGGAPAGSAGRAAKSRDSEGGSPLAYEVRGSWCRRPHQ